jgi:ABC-type arginine/histidine transport system permease subunit
MKLPSFENELQVNEWVAFKLYFCSINKSIEKAIAQICSISLYIGGVLMELFSIPQAITISCGRGNFNSVSSSFVRIFNGVPVIVQFI